MLTDALLSRCFDAPVSVTRHRGRVLAVIDRGAGGRAVSARISVAVFGSARLRPGDAEYEVARRLGALIAREGWDVRTGGYNGAMAAVSEGAAGEGGHVIGVTVAGWAHRLAPNRWVGEERAAEGLLARIEELLDADAWVAVAGGIGTLAELALAWNLLQIGDLAPTGPLVLVGERWEALLPAIRAHLVVDDADLALVRRADGPEEAIAVLREAHRGEAAGGLARGGRRGRADHPVAAGLLGRVEAGVRRRQQRLAVVPARGGHPEADRDRAGRRGAGLRRRAAPARPRSRPPARRRPAAGGRTPRRRCGTRGPRPARPG